MNAKSSLLKKNIHTLDLEEKVERILKANQIETIEELWSKTRKELKSYGIKDTEINRLIIKLQLLGLDLNKKVYKI